jgi:hypothetical protein
MEGGIIIELLKGDTIRTRPNDYSHAPCNYSHAPPSRHSKMEKRGCINERKTFRTRLEYCLFTSKVSRSTIRGTRRRLSTTFGTSDRTTALLCCILQDICLQPLTDQPSLLPLIANLFLIIMMITAELLHQFHLSSMVLLLRGCLSLEPLGLPRFFCCIVPA